MPTARFSFEGLDAVEARILRRAPQIGYVTIKDRTDRAREEQVGRFNLDEADALPYLEPFGREAMSNDDDEPDDELDEEPEDDEDDDGDDYDGEGDEAPSFADQGWPAALPAEPRLDQPLTPEDLAKATCRWLRDIAARHCVGEKYRRFRVRIYPPKGTKLLDGGQFVCRNLAWTDDLGHVATEQDAMPDLRIPAPNFDQVAKDSTLKGIKALGDYYAQWGQIVLGSVGQLQGVNNAMLGRLHRQLQESRGQVDELVASILEYRVSEVEAREQRRTAQHAGDARTELARDALQQLGTAATAFVAGRSVSPDLLETFGAISTSPELTEALRDPGVRALMKDPDNLRGLAAMLQAAGQQALAAQQAAGEAPDTPSAATGPPEPGSSPQPEPVPTQPEPHAAD